MVQYTLMVIHVMVHNSEKSMRKKQITYDNSTLRIEGSKRERRSCQARAFDCSIMRWYQVPPTVSLELLGCLHWNQSNFWCVRTPIHAYKHYFTTLRYLVTEKCTLTLLRTWGTVSPHLRNFIPKKSQQEKKQQQKKRQNHDEKSFWSNKAR